MVDLTPEEARKILYWVEDTSRGDDRTSVEKSIYKKMRELISADEMSRKPATDAESRAVEELLARMRGK